MDDPANAGAGHGSNDKLIVTCLRGALKGTRLVFDAAPVTFGRHPENDVVFPAEDAQVSGRHAEVRRIDGRWLLADLGSLNGTWVGEGKVTSHVLGPSTVVELGNGGPLVRMELHEGGARVVHKTELAAPAFVRSSGRTTTFYRMLINDTVKRSSARLKLVILALSVFFVVAIGVLWLVLSRETDRLSSETWAAGRAAESIASRSARSVFMLISERDGVETGFCTAFAISPDGVLATNAHCVRELKDLRSDSSSKRPVRIWARMNTAPENSFEVRTWKEHPAYDGTDLSPDVAVLGLDLRGGTLPVVAPLATREVVLALAAGQPIFTLGFPGQVMNEARPVADLRAAVVSRLTTRDNTPGDAASAYVVWHSALTSKGTSGSPIFDANGRIVAVNNGGLSARELLVSDPKTGTVKREVISEANGLNYGIRADRLAELLPEIAGD